MDMMTPKGVHAVTQNQSKEALAQNVGKPLYKHTYWVNMEKTTMKTQNEKLSEMVDNMTYHDRYFHGEWCFCVECLG